MAQATYEVGQLSESLHTAVRAAEGHATFTRGVAVAVALSLPVWAGLIYCAMRLL